MGYDIIEELNTNKSSMANVIINVEAAGNVYLVFTNPDRSKSSHMLLLLDLAGASDENNISGYMVHLKANMGDGHCPHSTTLDTQTWDCLRQNVAIIHVGNLRESHYLTNPAIVPPYVFQHHMQTIHNQIANLAIQIGIRSSLIQLIANNVYYKLVNDNNNKEVWTSKLNCHQFARTFITEGLGLHWPDDIDVDGDKLPAIIDIDTFFLSAK